MGLHQVKALLYSKGISNKVKEQLFEWEKIFPNSTSCKRLVFKIHKELKQLNSKSANNQIKKCARHKRGVRIGKTPKKLASICCP
jgi:uncharacterized protein (UPF0332 family)